MYQHRDTVGDPGLGRSFGFPFTADRGLFHEIRSSRRRPRHRQRPAMKSSSAALFKLPGITSCLTKERSDCRIADFAVKLRRLLRFSYFLCAMKYCLRRRWGRVGLSPVKKDLTSALRAPPSQSSRVGFTVTFAGAESARSDQVCILSRRSLRFFALTPRDANKVGRFARSHGKCDSDPHPKTPVCGETTFACPGPIVACISRDAHVAELQRHARQRETLLLRRIISAIKSAACGDTPAIGH
jgi:hypothetical protein